MSDAPTRLVLRCSGGFTGPAGAQTRTVDLAALPAAKAQHLEKLLQACDFTALPHRMAKAAPQSWDFEYTLQVQSGGQSHTVTFHKDQASPALQKLAEALDELPPD